MADNQDTLNRTKWVKSTCSLDQDPDGKTVIGIRARQTDGVEQVLKSSLGSRNAA